MKNLETWSARLRTVLITFFSLGMMVNALAQNPDHITVGRVLQTEMLLESILKSAPTGIGLVKDRVIIQINDYILELTGYTREELIGQNARMLYPTQDDFDFVGTEKYRQIAEKGTGTVETRWIRKDGAIIQVLMSSTPLDSDDLSLGVTFTVLDITESKQAREALITRTNWFLFIMALMIFVLLLLTTRLFTGLRLRKRAEERLQAERDQFLSLFNSIDEAIYISDPYTYELLYVNHCLASKLPDNSIGTKCYRTLQGLDAPCPFCTNEKILACQPEPYRWEHYNPVLERTYSIVDRIIRWADGRDVRFEMALDITLIKQAEKMLTLKNKELEQIVFVTSHDLRSPLVNVEGFSRELIYSIHEVSSVLNDPEKDYIELEEKIREVFPEMEQDLERIRKSAHQMDNLLKGLLKLSRSGRAALQITTLDMNDLIEKVCNSFSFAIQERNIALVAEKLPECKGDEVQVTQVFANLVENALKYLDPNRTGKVRIYGSVEAGYSVYCIEDNGIGIAENHQEAIFELFHRLNPKDSEGEGLGLTIVKQILERLDGRIHLESKIGQGSIFTVQLPYAEHKRRR